LVLSTHLGAQIASREIGDLMTSPQAFTSIVKVAEQVARAQHLLGLRCENPKELLNHRVDITFGLVACGKRGRTIPQHEKNYVTEQDRVFISLQNNGASTVYISVFDLNVAGEISLVSTSSPKGIELRENREYVLGDDQFGLGLIGLPISWPDNVPKRPSVDEHLILILTSHPVDLRHLADPSLADSSLAAFRDCESLTDLERLTLKISTGRTVTVESENAGVHILFDTVHIPFSLQSLEYQKQESSSSITAEERLARS
jgi:hypothetical protein